MAEQPNPGTPPTTAPDPTGETPPATDDKGQGGATPPADPKGGSTTDGETVTLSNKDYQNLISQRDKNFGEVKTADARLDELEATNASLMRDQFIGRWLSDNKESYSDVSAEDLDAAMTPEDVEAIAKRVQGKADKIRQDAQKDLTKVGQPKISKEDRADRLKDAAKNHDLVGAIEAKLAD